MQNALVVTAIDGLATLECGIASVVHWFFEDFDNIVKNSATLKKGEFALHAISPSISLKSTDFAPKVHEIVAKMCQKHHGAFHWTPVTNNKNLKTVWSLADKNEWEIMCQNVAIKVRELATRYDKVTLLVHGVMLTAIRKYLRDIHNVQVVFMTHSLGHVFNDKHSQNRIDFEVEAFEAMAKFPQDKIGYIGDYFKEVLKEKYAITEDRLASFKNSIVKNSFRFIPSPNSSLEQIYAKYKFPTNKKLIFSWGRCTGQKGFDVLIPAFKKFYDLPGAQDYHLVILMPQECSDDAYVQEINKQLTALELTTYTAITHFDEELAYFLLQSPKTAMAVFTSRFEGGPLTMIEALHFGHEHLKIVFNDIAPMRHLMKQQPVSFPFSPLDVENCSAALYTAMQHKGRSISKEQLESYAGNMATGLAQTIGIWWKK